MCQVCGSRARERSVYVSETNRLEVVIMSSKLDNEPVYFLLKYEGTWYRMFAVKRLNIWQRWRTLFVFESEKSSCVCWKKKLVVEESITVDFLLRSHVVKA